MTHLSFCQNAGVHYVQEQADQTLLSFMNFFDVIVVTLNEKFETFTESLCWNIISVGTHEKPGTCRLLGNGVVNFIGRLNSTDGATIAGNCL